MFPAGNTLRNAFQSQARRNFAGMRDVESDLPSNGHLQVIGDRGHRRWRAFSWDADGKHSRVLGRAWVQSSGRRTPRGAIVWHAADGPKPDPSYLTPREAAAELRRLFKKHDAARTPTPRTRSGAVMTFADAARAWLSHGQRSRNLKRSTVRDYNQVLTAYLLRGADDSERPSRYGRAPFAETPLREISSAQLKAWHDALPYGRTTEKLLMVVRAMPGHAASHGWIDRNPALGVRQRPVRYSGDYDFYAREEVDSLVAAAASPQDAAIFLTAAMTGLRRGELVALRWRDIDFPGQAIRVRATTPMASWSRPRAAG